MADASTIYDAATLRHLDAWLVSQLADEDTRAMVRDAMLQFAADDDAAYWADRGWPDLWVIAGGPEIERMAAQQREAHREAQR